MFIGLQKWRKMHRWDSKIFTNVVVLLATLESTVKPKWMNVNECLVSMETVLTTLTATLVTVTLVTLESTVLTSINASLALVSMEAALTQ